MNGARAESVAFLVIDVERGGVLQADREFRRAVMFQEKRDGIGLPACRTPARLPRAARRLTDK